MKISHLVLGILLCILFYGNAKAIPIGNDIEFFGAERTMGLGILNPDTLNSKLDINGQILIREGFSTSPKAGLVLTTANATGLAQWSEIDFSQVRVDNLVAEGTDQEVVKVLNNNQVNIVSSNTVPNNVALNLSGGGIAVPNGPILSSDTSFEGSPTRDGFRLRRIFNFFDTVDGASGRDAILFEKTDANDASPDGGLVFGGTGADNNFESLLTLRTTGPSSSGSVGINYDRRANDSSTKLIVNGASHIMGNMLLEKLSGLQLRLRRKNIPTDGAGLGNLYFSSFFNATSTADAAQIVAEADGDWSNSNKAANLYFKTASNSGSLQRRLVIRSDGKIAIGGNGLKSTPPTHQFELRTGNASKPGGGSWLASSDARLKNVIDDYQTGLAAINSLNALKFKYKKNNPRQLPSDTEYVGFIAQEVLDEIPEAVQLNKDGYYDLDMHAINVALVNAVQELSEELEKKDQLIHSILDRLEKLEAN